MPFCCGTYVSAIVEKKLLNASAMLLGSFIVDSPEMISVGIADVLAGAKSLR